MMNAKFPLAGQDVLNRRVFLRHRMAVIAALTATLFSPLQAQSPKRVWPEQVQRILDNAAALELISLDPAEEDRTGKKGYFGWKVMGKTTLPRDKPAGKALLEAWNKAIRQEKMGAKCFWPRHAIHAEHDGKSIDLVICFECSWVYVYLDGKQDGWTKFPIDRTVQADFDKLLTDAKLPLAKTYKN